MSLTIDGTDVQTAALWIDVESGFNEPAVVRGKDDVVPEADGQEPGVWQADHRDITLTAYVEGQGATELERQQSWRAASDTLRNLMDRTVTREYVMGPPDHGVQNDWSINARCINAMPGPILNAWTYQKWSITVRSIDSPPEWVDESA